MKKILFVCLGNICRSPAAEEIMNSKLRELQMSEAFACDSCGTSSYHEGEMADARMRHFCSQKGYDLKSISRPFRARKDFEEFDYIIAMDRRNLRDLKELSPVAKHHDKLMVMTQFCTQFDDDGVPDPYYQGDEGFQYVIELLEDAIHHFSQYIIKEGEHK